MNTLIPDPETGGGLGRKPFVSFRPPVAEDGVAVSELIARCPPLDRNSVYCTLLQCTHFAGTCVVAEGAGRVVGWVSGYIVPDEPATLFVWQVAVAPEWRGRRLAQAMLEDILARPACRAVQCLKTTITIDNSASWRLFRGFADAMGAAFDSGPYFFKGSHFAGAHATEHLVTIGPFSRAR